MDEKLVAKRMKAVEGALEERAKGFLEAEELYCQADEKVEWHRTKFWARIREMGARGMDFLPKGKLVVHFDDGDTVTARPPVGSRFEYEESGG